MTRPGNARRRTRHREVRPIIELLEGRALPTGSTAIGFLSALGVGVTGKYAAIRSDAVATDLAGDTFVTGSFRGTAAFNPGNSSSTVTTASTQDTFVAKYGPNGAPAWVATFAGQATTNAGGFTTYAVSQGSAIAVDGSGNVFVAGSFSGTVNVTGASGVIREVSATSATEPFVAKLNSSGLATWFDAVAGTAYDTDSANALALDGSGGVVIAGSFAESATFGSTSLTASGSSDAFVARVNGSGSFVWAVASRGVNGSNASVQGLAVDGSGNVDVSGYLSGTVDFDPSAGITQLTSAGSFDALLWKLDSTGKFLWARSFGSPDYDDATSVAVDSSGNLYATGAFSDTVNFGTASQPDTVTAGPVYDGYVLKVDPNGNTTWVVGLVGPNGSSKGQGIAIDSFGIAHVAGTFSGPVDFDPGPATDTLTSTASSDVFSAGFDSGGNLVYALQAGQANFNAALGVAVNPTGTVSITGTDSGSIAFGASTLPSLGVASVFVAQVTTQISPPPPSAPVLEAASDSGISHSDAITNVTSPVLDVNAAGASNTVELLRNGVVVAHRTGPGALSDPGPLAQGIFFYTAMQISPAGLIGAASPATSVTILTALPASPPAPTIDAAEDSGIVGDGITNVKQPRLAVVVVGSVTVQILNASGTVIGSAYQASGGTCLVTPFQPFPDGVYSVMARVVDIAGNVGPAGPALTLTVDTTPPAAPSVPSLLAGDDSATLGDGITNIRQPRLIGSAEPGSTVQIVDAKGNSYGTAVASGSGAFTVKVSSPLVDGTYVLSARATDSAGNQGPAGASMSLVILATPPPIPSTPSIVVGDVSGPAGSNLTNVRQPRITGTAKLGTTVDILTTTGSLLAVATAGPGGVYTAKLTNPLADGSFTLDAVAIDAAGNMSPASGTLTFTIDTTPPPAPSIPILLMGDDSGTLGDRLTNVRQPRLTGTAEPGSTVQLVDGAGNSYGSAVASGTGGFTVMVSSPLADGTYPFSARATDAAGNQGPAGPSMSLAILSTPPAPPPAPTLLASDDSGTLGDGLTNVRQPRLAGKTAANATVQLFGASGNLLASTTSASDGTYLARLASPLADGNYAIHAVATDAAGNVSPSGAAFSLTILTMPPAAPSTPGLLLADDSGTVGDGITNVRQPRLTGTESPNLTVRLIDASGTVLGSSTATSAGAVTLSPSTPLADGVYTFSLVAVDAAGNVSVPGGTLGLTILATPPPQPSAPSLLAADDTGITGDGLTSVRRPRIGGTAAPGGRIDWLAANGSVLASTTASAKGGTYQLQPPTALVNGPYSVKVRETDLAGNVSVASPAFNLTIRSEPGDDFGDGQADISVFRTSDATFFVQRPTTGALFLMQFGGPGDVPVNGDFFGNGHNDIAIYRPSNSTFYVFDPVTNAVKVSQLGQTGDVPVPADFDGDGQVDFAVFRPSTSTFIVQMSATNTTSSRQFGGNGDIPVPADYFGNGHADLAVYRPSSSTFYVHDPIAGGIKIVAVGPANSTPVPADYEGLGHVDPGVYQSSTSTFSILMTATNTTYSRSFGGPGDIPIPGDFLGNGRADLAIFRPSLSAFFALDIPTSAAKVVGWGTPNATWPTLAPITFWSSFGGSGSAEGSARVLDSTLGSPEPPQNFAIIPWTPDLAILSIPPNQVKAVDRAIHLLSLESWRPVP